MSWQHTVIYELYTPSFKDSNGDGFGDLNGALEKLDYLAWLGITAVWLPPIFRSPFKDFGYDVSDYCDINPQCGTLDNALTFISEAHKRNIKVLFDFVVNHTSDQHPWFIEASKSRDNPYHNWYIRSRARNDGSLPNNHISVFGNSTWHYNKHLDLFYYHSFLAEQPDLNYRNPAVLKAMKQQMKFWLDRGVDGFRLDAVPWVLKHPDLLDESENVHYVATDDPYNKLLHLYSKYQPEMLNVIKQFCDLAATYSDRFIISEAYPDAVEDISWMTKLYNVTDGTLHAPFNFACIFLPWQASRFKSFVDMFQASLSKGYIPIYVLGNHDRSRLATRVGDAQARIASFLLLTLPGMPTIYYGDEIGMKDSYIPVELRQDPFGKEDPASLLGRDPERTPMQWSDKEGAGFSEIGVKAWLPISPEFKLKNVEDQKNDPHSLLMLYKILLKMRSQTSALTSLSHIPIDTGNKDVFGYERCEGLERWIVLLNFSSVVQNVVLNYDHALLILNSSLDEQKGNVDLHFFNLRPDEGYLFYLKRSKKPV